ncbi:MAG TPA: CotH kinase family protein [Solirubrobacterales bacterium]|nr:CotH kinase family protein [Solirubrobacterales bacterium]
MRRAIGAAILASVLALAAPAAHAAEPGSDPAAWLYDPTTVVEIDLDLPQATIDALAVEPDEYQPATFTLEAGGETYGPLSVGARLKGNTASFRPLSRKAAFKVKFDEYVEDQTFFGLEKLTLNNMVQDPSMLHETFAYELFRAVGVAAPRTGYAVVRVNGERYGLYLNVETLDKISLPLWFGSTQHLYEGGYGTDATPGEAGAFEVDEGKNSKREDLEALIAAVNVDGGDWSDGVGAVADLPQMTRMWAVERYVGHWDGYAGHTEPADVRPNNYFLHSDQAGVFRMLPWGTDQTWIERLRFDEPAGGVLFNRCLADASCEALYVDALTEVSSVVGGLEIGRRAAEIAELLAPCQALEEAPRREYDAGRVAGAVGEVRDFVADRPGELADWLGLPVAEPAPEDPPGSLGEAPCPPLPPDPPVADAPASASSLSSDRAVAPRARPRRRCAPPSRAAMAPVRSGRIAVHRSRPVAGRARRRCR